MINVSDFTKKVYSEYNVPKYLTVSFPNDNIPDITNENIYGESMRLTQSICEENTLIFGGCNAAQFELTVLDVEEDLSDKDIVVNISVKDPHYKGFYVNGRAYKENDVVIQSRNYYSFLIPWGSDLSISSWIRTTSGSTVVFTSDSINNSGNGTRIYFENNDFDEITIQLLETIVPPQIEDEVLVVHENQSSFSNDVIEYANAPSVNEDILEFPTIIRTNNVEASFEDNYVVENIEDDVESYQIRISSQLEDESNALHSRICLTDRFDSVNNYREHNFGYIDTSLTDDIVLFRGKIVSANRQKDRRLKDIIAYDALYEAAKIDGTSLIPVSNKSYVGDWVRGKYYNVGEIVRFNNEFSPNPGYEYYKRISYDGAAQYNPNSQPSSGSVGWETSGITRTVLNTFVSSLSTTLGIIFDSSNQLHFNGYVSTMVPKSDYYGAVELLKTICNINEVCAVINPINAHIIFKSLAVPEVDPYYNGEFVSGTTYVENQVVCVRTDEEGAVYYKCLMDAVYTNPPNDDSENWRRMSELYHPSGKINYSRLYEYDSLEYSDNVYRCQERKYVDDNGDVIVGTSADNVLSIIPGAIKDYNESPSRFLAYVNSELGSASYEYDSTNIKALGLPFVEVGDWITYDVEEYHENGVEIKNKKTPILKRVLSGINMLTDEIESRYE